MTGANALVCKACRGFNVVPLGEPRPETCHQCGAPFKDISDPEEEAEALIAAALRGRLAEVESDASLREKYRPGVCPTCHTQGFVRRDSGLCGGCHRAANPRCPEMVRVPQQWMRKDRWHPCNARLKPGETRCKKHRGTLGY